MANGDVTYLDVLEWIVHLELTTTSKPSDAEVDTWCSLVNNEVNLALIEAGFALDLTASRNISWANLTKRFGACAITLATKYGLAGTENPLAASWQRSYDARLKHLRETGGSFLDDTDRDTSADVQYAPVLVGYSGSDARKRHLLFRERAAVQQYDDEQGLATVPTAPWVGRTRRV